MKKLLRLLASIFVSVGLTTGVAAAATGTIGTTGPFSDNDIAWENETDIDVDNETDVDADVDIDQDADSGWAKVGFNTTGGDAESGDAMNDSSFDAEISVDNSGSSSGALSWMGGGDDEASINGPTGPSSDNSIRFENEVDIDVNNDTDVDFDLDVDQDAESGNASVFGNTTGGSATTGSASNTSSGSFVLTVTN